MSHGNHSSAGYVAGDVIAGKYRLERLLGEGGVGAVWLARNLKLGSSVALKLVRHDLNAPDAAHRLLKEARAEARLEHRAIVRAFDFGETEYGEPFIVMELLEGRDFGELLDETNKLEPTHAARILLAVIEALSYAHEQGVIHRDLKPENIFLAKHGKKTQPKIVDFGIAKLTQFDATATHTQGGVVLGTPAYMAPEQARGLHDLDHRVDTWALCVVLYEAVTGHRPFSGDNYNAVMRSVIEDEPLPIADHGIDENKLWLIIRRGLDKRADKRWQSMKDLGVVIAAWLASKGETDDIVGESLEQTWLAGVDREEVLALGEEKPSMPPFSSPSLRSGESPAPGWSTTWAQQARNLAKPGRELTAGGAEARSQYAPTLRPASKARNLVLATALGIVAAVLLAQSQWFDDRTPGEMQALGTRAFPRSVTTAAPDDRAIRSALPATAMPPGSAPAVLPSAPAAASVSSRPAASSAPQPRVATARVKAEKPSIKPPALPAKSAIPPKTDSPPAKSQGTSTPQSDLKDPY